MGLRNLVTQFLRPAATQTKSSKAGPMIAWSQVGQPRWTPRRYENLAEEGFRKNVIAYRCVMQVATAASAIPWLLYDDQGHEIERHPLLDLLCHPNPLQDGVSFMENVYAHLEIAGNAYIEAVTPHDNAPPVELYVLRPDRMKVIPGPSGLPQGYQYTVNSQTTTWPADPITGASPILHLKRFHPLDDWYGMPPMEAAAVSIDQHNAAGSWNQALLNQGARPSGALVFSPKDGPATLSDDQMRRLREEMSQLYQGDKNAGRPLILEGGLDWREMSLSPKDMDWLAGRNTAARDIALAFGVPAQMVGIPDSQTYANMAEARMAFYEETILPLVTRVIAGFDHWLTPMYDDHLELDFDPDAISALSARRDAQWTKVQNASFLTRNERREAVGYGPVPGGDASDEDDGGDADPDPAAKYNHNHDELGRFATGDGDTDSNGEDNSDDESSDGDINGDNKPVADDRYSPDKPGWHDYVSGPTLVCTAAQNCTAEEMADQLSRFAVPGQDPAVPVVNGQVYLVSDPKTDVPVGYVKVSVSNDGLTVANITQPEHIFYDGEVIREAYQGSDGAWYMLTQGKGNNKIPSMAEVNQALGPGIFQAFDRLMRTNIERHNP